MDMEKFCNDYCPMPFRGTDRTGVIEVDCDCEDSECPFKDVDFTKVILYGKQPKPEGYGVYAIEKVRAEPWEHMG